MDESAFGVHEIELVRKGRPSFSDGSGVGKHATFEQSALYLFKKSRRNLHSAVDLGQITVGNHLRWLVTDTDLESSRAPVNELDSPLGLKSGNSKVDIVGNNIATVQQAGGHVLSIARVTLHHLVVGLEAGHGDLLNGVGLVGCLRSGDNWGVGNEREMDAGVWDQVGLELVEIDVEGTIKSEGSSDRRNNYSTLVLECLLLSDDWHTLGNEAVQVDIVGTLETKVLSADVVDSLVINHERTVRVLEGGVGGEDGVVWLND